MSRSVTVMPAAKDDLYELLSWLKTRSPAGAASWLRAWHRALDRLSRGSLPGLAPENGDHEFELRQLLFKTRKGRVYRAIITIRDNEVVVLRVRGPGKDLLSSDDIENPPDVAPE